MYEQYYGFTEKPFSLTPDPKYLYRSESHANAFDLLQYAIRRREGFVIVTGDIGTGKTTLCRALLEQIDRTTFTALVLNPFLSEQDLLKRILQENLIPSAQLHFSFGSGRRLAVDLLSTGCRPAVDSPSAVGSASRRWRHSQTTTVCEACATTTHTREHIISLSHQWHTKY